MLVAKIIEIGSRLISDIFSETCCSLYSTVLPHCVMYENCNTARHVAPVTNGLDMIIGENGFSNNPSAAKAI